MFLMPEKKSFLFHKLNIPKHYRKLKHEHKMVVYAKKKKKKIGCTKLQTVILLNDHPSYMQKPERQTFTCNKMFKNSH